MKPNPNALSASTQEQKIVLNAIILPPDEESPAQAEGTEPVSVASPAFHVRKMLLPQLPLPPVQALFALAPATVPGLNVRPASASPHPLSATQPLPTAFLPLRPYPTLAPITGNHPSSMGPIPPPWCAPTNTMPLSVSTPVSDGERPAKRRRIAEPQTSPIPGGGLPEFDYSPTAISPSKECFPPPPIKRPPVNRPAPEGATEKYSVEGMKDEDLVSSAELLGLDRFVGLNLLRQACRENSPHFANDQDRFDFVKNVVSCLSLMEEKIGRAEQEFPEKLQVNLTIGLVKFLKNSYTTMYVHRSTLAVESQKLTIKLFNKNHLILNMVGTHCQFLHRHDWRFTGGKVKFDFLCWCADKGLQLDDDQLAEFTCADFHMRKMNIPKICKRIGLEVREAEKNKST